MSLDNVLAIAGAADGSTLLAVIGIMISIPIVVFASQFIVILMNRFPILIWIGALLVAYTAGSMIIEDRLAAQWLNNHIAGISHTHLIPILACGLLIVVSLVNKATKQQHAKN
ncbi:hypothetical protein ATO00_05485 [Loigolactobacillus coryniformis subsp. coryniformis]|uniref:TerC family protein n=1 Tax=Loigolactobacillus coryniformis subsp. coryniformis KCTC 3167 = DSM 20001 TaxID=913848 RepID=A0A0R1EUQ7_9LACO|nr:hypothetical protein LC20001_02605 [Loigolactobacillus coryniformis subsp. coryniformis KCTC 3167 = DSM 20001]KRK11042.1 hypothetical protein FD22_GL000607 [Loigolactobacillus coryniformis subsp. coryniformis KCTC 3167 = DSM 20001]OEH90283.1 hypothetical protein ATO00_05485 [Loigolactobacillus coryniformis subsp. coryniformis]